MTENTTLPDAQRDGKAQAAAEKAYRKASRPWFKKKRFILPLALVLIMIISSIANGGKDDDPKNTAALATEASAAPPAAEAPVVPPAAPAPKAPAAAEVVPVDAATLLADFEGNEAAADAKYKGKVLQVTGNVNKVDTEFLDKNQYIVRLDDGAEFSFLTVNCSDVAAAKAATVVPKSTITVQGTFQDGGDLGVELKACEVLS